MRTKTLKKNTINVVTLGCSKNVYDSEVLMGQLKANGKEVVHEQEGNVVVINTCGFINNAKEESVNTILEYMQKKEEGAVDKVFVTGCLSERYKPDLQKEIPNVDQYFGTTELLTAFTIFAPSLMIPPCSDFDPTMNPVTSCKKTKGIFFWLQLAMNRVALSAESE